MSRNLSKKLNEAIFTSYVGNQKLCFDCKNMDKNGYCKLSKKPVYYFNSEKAFRCLSKT